MKISIFNILVLLLYANVLCYGQTQKRAVTVADYGKWSLLHAADISPDGRWVSFGLRYDYGADTLFVQDCKSSKKLAFPAGSNPVFSADSRWFASTDSVKRLSLLELKSGNLRTYANVERHQFYSALKYWVMLRNTGNSIDLLVYEYDKNREHCISNVLDFSIANDGTIAIVRSQEVSIIKPTENFTIKTITTDSSAVYKKLEWSKNSKILSFFQELPDDSVKPRNHKVYWYSKDVSKLKVLQSSDINLQKSQRILLRKGAPAVTFSEDGNCIFIATSSGYKESKQEPYEVWDSQTPYEYSQNKYHGDLDNEPKLWMWTPNKAELTKVGTDNSPSVLLTSDRKSAIVFNPIQYEPQYEHYAPADFYIKDLATGATNLILKNQSTAIGMMGGSPKGRYVHYFKDENWWVYDNTKHSHLNITAGFGLELVDTSDQYPGLVVPFDCPGWSNDEKTLIIYDTYDIWLFSPDGKKSQRITNGRKNKVKYRIYTDPYNKNLIQSKDDFRTQSHDFSKGLIVEALGENMESGYFEWFPKLELIKLVYNKSGISNLRKATNSESYVFIEQSATIPPKLMLKENKLQEPKLLFQSNGHTKNYDWGTAELINYKNSAGENLKGILYKPSGYVKGQKYPLIVLVYEKVSHKFHDYYLPTQYSPMGFTPSNYFLDDYLVLLPDISYTIGSPGLSSTDCIESAVAEVKKYNIVLENRIGIIGHSYGGYEVAFAISHSNTFAAAVAGSGIMNLTTSYFTYDSAVTRSNAWRFESQQGRMGYSPFDNWESYQENSPLKHAYLITTPLLSWVGRKDFNVLWNQSAELHMSLRRLGKKNIFLVYNNESHTIHNSELQKDLTTKTKNWFDFYLKGSKDALRNGMP